MGPGLGLVYGFVFLVSQAILMLEPHHHITWELATWQNLSSTLGLWNQNLHFYESL